MHIQVLEQSMNDVVSDIAIVPVFENEEAELGSIAAAFNKIMDNKVYSLIQDGEIQGKFAQTTVIHNFERSEVRKALLIGAGKRNELTGSKIRQLAAIALQNCRKCRAKKVAVAIGDFTASSRVDHAKAAQALAEGAILGSYTFEYYKSTADDQAVHIEELNILAPVEAGESVRKSILLAKTYAEATNFARDLVNQPGNAMTPGIMADRAMRVAERNGLQIYVLEREDMEREGMGALLAVSQGSIQPPKLIVLKYMGNPQAETIAFIGKGVTFDSGGISLKPSNGMGEMKTDMAGGAAVIGALKGISELKPKVNVLGIIPATENMPAGNALKPGDIVRSLSGRTIEIITTDAEGRLILADAITYAKQLGAKKVIDVATLTGACVVALGTVASGVVTNNQSWCQTVLAAADQADEKMWQLPNFPEYKEQIKGVLADLKNSGGKHAGTITAGLFLGEFAEDIPWVHIDIAGTASVEKPHGCPVKGATGTAVRTLIQVALNAE